MSTMRETYKSLIYKICPTPIWEKACADGCYIGSTDDRRDGFIHFSAVSQIYGTLEKHFKGQSDLLLIGVNPAQLGQALKWEPSRGGQLFPHLYGKLPISAALWARPIPLDLDGRHSIRGLIPDFNTVDPSSNTNKPGKP
jgi:uncharacterized protein (DUF952 family)